MGFGESLGAQRCSRAHAISHAVGLVSIGLGLLSQACISSAGTVFEPARMPKLHVEARAAEVKLVEERMHVSTERVFDTPFFSWPGDGAERELKLGPRVNDRLQNQLDALLLDSAPGALTVEVHVLLAKAGWHESMTAESAFTNVALGICVFDASDHSLLLGGFQDGWARVNRADVADRQPAELLDLTVTRVWEQWLNDRNIAQINAAVAGRIQPRATDFPGCQRGPSESGASHSPRPVRVLSLGIYHSREL